MDDNRGKMCGKKRGPCQSAAICFWYDNNSPAISAMYSEKINPNPAPSRTAHRSPCPIDIHLTKPPKTAPQLQQLKAHTAQYCARVFHQTLSSFVTLAQATRWRRGRGSVHRRPLRPLVTVVKPSSCSPPSAGDSGRSSGVRGRSGSRAGAGAPLYGGIRKND